MPPVHNDATHWDETWSSRSADEFSWHQADPAVSLDLITQVAGPGAAIVDVGGGASVLAGRLIDAGFDAITVVDISAAALAAARDRLGGLAGRVTWRVADVTSWTPERRFDVWHDRAVLHFLTEQHDRDRYVRTLRRALAPTGHVVVASFALDGPEMCSGLPVRRYDRDMMIDTLGPDFEPLEFTDEIHTTPTGRPQHFLYGLFRRADSG